MNQRGWAFTVYLTGSTTSCRGANLLSSLLLNFNLFQLVFSNLSHVLLDAYKLFLMQRCQVSEQGLAEHEHRLQVVD